MTANDTRTRLADLAAQAGVSTATVSRVLNRKPGVSEATRQSVYRAMDLLGYQRPRRPAPSSAGLVGLVIPELSNPVFPAFAQAIETAFAHYGYTPLLCTQTSSGITEDEYVDTLLGAEVAGIVFVNGLHADATAPLTRYERLNDQGVPYVLVNGSRPELSAPSVSVDERLGMELAVRHLVSLGHRRIALAVGPDRLVPAAEKRAGFAAAIRRHLGSFAEHRVINSLFTVEGGQAATRVLLAEGFTAVVCGSDLMALGAVRAAAYASLSVPEDFSVVGFDDSLFAAFTAPPLTTLRQPVDAMSEAAVSLLLARIRGEREPAPDLHFDPVLVVRASTGAVSARPELHGPR